MKASITILISALIFLTISCQSDSHELTSIPEIEINENSARAIELPDLFEASRLIKLVYTPESVVGNIELLQYHDGFIYIASPKEGNEQRDLVIFDEKGSFIKRIDANGEGPGSIFSASDFFVSDDGELEILDRNRRRIVKYSPDGAFIENIHTPCEGIRFIKLPNQGYVIYRGFAFEFTEPKGIPFNLSRFNKNLECEFLNRLWMNPIFRDRTLDAGAFFFPAPKEKGWHICDVFNDTIFYMNSDLLITPAFRLKTPDHEKKWNLANDLNDLRNSISSSDFNLKLLEFLNDPSMVKKLDLIMKLPSNDILVSYRRNSKRYFARIDLASKTSETFTINSSLLDNWFVFQYGADKFAIVINSPLDLSQNLSAVPEQLAAFPKPWRESLQHIKSDVNPYLLIVKPDALF